MSSPFQAVVDVFDRKLTQTADLRLPLTHYMDTQVSKIVSQVGKRAVDVAEGVNVASSEQLDDCIGDLKKRAEGVLEDLKTGLFDPAKSGFDTLADQLRGMFSELADATEDELKQWMTSLGINDLTRKLSEKARQVKDWLGEQLRQKGDGVIKVLEHLQAGFNRMMHEIDGLAVGAGELTGCLLGAVGRVPCVMGSVALGGLEHLSQIFGDKCQRARDALRNDTRTTKDAGLLNGQIAIGSSSVPMNEVPPYLPGADVANATTDRARREMAEARQAAKRQVAGKADKMRAATGATGSAMAAQTPSQAKTSPSNQAGQPAVPTFPNLPDAKKEQAKLAVDAAKRRAAEKPQSVHREYKDTLKRPPVAATQHNDDKSMRAARTQTPVVPKYELKVTKIGDDVVVNPPVPKLKLISFVVHPATVFPGEQANIVIQYGASGGNSTPTGAVWLTQGGRTIWKKPLELQLGEALETQLSYTIPKDMPEGQYQAVLEIKYGAAKVGDTVELLVKRAGDVTKQDIIQLAHELYPGSNVIVEPNANLEKAYRTLKYGSTPSFRAQNPTSVILVREDWVYFDPEFLKGLKVTKIEDKPIDTNQ